MLIRALRLRFALPAVTLVLALLSVLAGPSSAAAASWTPGPGTPVNGRRWPRS